MALQTPEQTPDGPLPALRPAALKPTEPSGSIGDAALSLAGRHALAKNAAAFIGESRFVPTLCSLR